MPFKNQKKTYLSKLDKSKKAGIDKRMVDLIKTINEKENYYTTSSCSGRVYLWQGDRKNNIKFLNISHDLIDKEFLKCKSPGQVWLRLEPFIMHIACKDLDSANQLLSKSKEIYKKSNILTASNKVILEVRGSEFLEVPLYENTNLLFTDLELLKSIINEKMSTIWKKEGLFYQIISKS